MSSDRNLVFEAFTPLGFRVEVTQERWKLITTVKHPVMAGRAGDVRTVLENPDEIRESRSDRNVAVILPGRWPRPVDLRGREAGGA